MNDERKDIVTEEETFFGNEPVVITEEEARKFLGEEDVPSTTFKQENDERKVEKEDIVEKDTTISTDDLSLKMEEINEYATDEKLLEATATIPTATIMERVSSMLGESTKDSGTDTYLSEEKSSADATIEKVETPVEPISVSSTENGIDSSRQVPAMDTEVMKSLENVDAISTNDVAVKQEETPVVTNPVEPEQNTVQEVEVIVKKKRRNPFIIILNIFATLFFLFILFEVVIAFLNFNLIKQKKEPSYFATKSVETKGQFDYTIYDMGLFKIVRKEDQKEYSIKLLPFFMDI